VIDEYGNSTVWEEPFQSDKEALDEAMKDIGSKANTQWVANLHDPLLSDNSIEVANTKSWFALKYTFHCPLNLVPNILSST
jgi:hypothetical protein